MDLENHLRELMAVKGVRAGGVMHFTGELLGAESIDPQLDLGMVGATFNDVFRRAHELCGKVGLAAAQDLVLRTPKGVAVMASSDEASSPHLHMIAILSVDGNAALAALQMRRALPRIVAALA